MLGLKIKTARMKRNISQGELARYVGVDRQSIFNWEKGTYEPKPTQLKIIARVLKFPISYFFGYKQHNIAHVRGLSKNVA
jgi:DNA-binding XRE family transcriptional regulator